MGITSNKILDNFLNAMRVKKHSLLFVSGCIIIVVTLINTGNRIRLQKLFLSANIIVIINDFIKCPSRGCCVHDFYVFVFCKKVTFRGDNKQ